MKPKAERKCSRTGAHAATWHRGYEAFNGDPDSKPANPYGGYSMQERGFARAWQEGWYAALADMHPDYPLQQTILGRLKQWNVTNHRRYHIDEIVDALAYNGIPSAADIQAAVTKLVARGHVTFTEGVVDLK